METKTVTSEAKTGSTKCVLSLGSGNGKTFEKVYVSDFSSSSVGVSTQVRSR